MKVIKLLGYVPITLGMLKEYKNGARRLPSKPIIITFDDGMQDVMDNAVPILQNKGFSATFYIPTDYLGKQSSWMMPEVNVEFQITDWATIKTLDAMGFEVGAHTMTHPRLSRISEKDCYKELSESRQKLEDALGHEVRHLAYPYGDYDENVRLIADETGYHTACTTEERFADISGDMLTLARLNIGMEEDSILNFLCKITAADSPIGLLARKIQIIRQKIPEPVKKHLKKRLY